MAKTQAVAPPAAAEAPDSVRKSTQFSDIEVYELLQIILARKPIGMDMWKEVEADFSALAATHQGFCLHPALSLKQKFTRLCKMKRPTGDQLMPPIVWLANQINAEILHEVSAGELEP